MDFSNSIEFARRCDHEDSLSRFRSMFHLPVNDKGIPQIYFAGNSLGLQPKSTAEYINTELRDWQRLGVEGHIHARHPWMPYHELLTEQSATLVGALPREVVVMNSLTVNLHLLMVSFYRPTAARYKILIEDDAFPSDKYAVASQARYHGFDPSDAIVSLKPREGEVALRTEDILSTIAENGQSIATIMLGGVNYYTGQLFDMQAITSAGHDAGCVVGFDLAHAAGNVKLSLHDWNVDFAAWCTYKYLNSGPGGIAAAFVNNRHVDKQNIARFNGWWGHDKASRFTMPDDYVAIPTAEAWQLSNPPIFQLASLRASLDIFSEAGLDNLVNKSKHLTGYMEYLVKQIDDVNILTPSSLDERGCQLSLVIRSSGRRVFDEITKSGVICDWREPDVIRIAPVPLYNSFEDVHRFAQTLRQALARLNG